MKNIVSVIHDLNGAAVKLCNVQLMKLKECKDHHKPFDVVKPTPLSKQENILVIPKKVKVKAKVVPKKGRRKL